ncbi:hypothetical protein GCM10007231_34390 [Nocardioides daphniae]|uniref:TIGR02611 family protein n=2 Tax=Nocardioides daphniae TaxID=402297 RepID=A0A4P7UHF8_9ACTN|nr:TIGR02611 family protein [Nocardioides daphniae]GGD32005.1 hypothetical protein GCM10007231_34390 [Nocardioides daphniae]
MDDTERDLERAEQEYFGPRFLARIHARLHQNPVTSILTKIVVTTVGVLVILAGVVMMVAPGPGILGLIFGLAILSTEWRWADRWLDAARDAAHRAAEKAREMDPVVRRKRVAVLAMTALLVGLLVYAVIDAHGWPHFAVEGWDWVQGLSGVVPELPGMPR